MRMIEYSKAINEALDQTMKKDQKVIIVGLGVDDPKGVFGTTKNLDKNFKDRIFDLPTAENGFTGFSLGLAISGYKPVMVHQRVEFSLLAFDQIVNQISKWYYMSGGKVNVPIVIRLIIGKGWGQGPQHSQSLEALFAHIPGLKVIAPSNAEDAKGMLISSINDPDPVVFFEHRWLHSTLGNVNKKYFQKNINKAKIINKGDDITIISFSYALIECLKALKFLKKNKINCDLIDLRSLRPIDFRTIIKSASKTKKVLIVDNGMVFNGVSSEISATINEEIKEKIKIKRIGVIQSPIPSTISLAKYCYPDDNQIIQEVLKILNLKKKKVKQKKDFKPDQPDKNFLGPF
jgi:acetoin:2,6-dichlorophenolindophenol oxidoreductase subunit beta